MTAQFQQSPTDLADGTTAAFTVFCPAGETAVGGGYRGDDQDSEETIVGSSTPVRAAGAAGSVAPPVDDQTFSGWRTTMKNPTGGVTTGIRPEVWAFCVAAS